MAGILISSSLRALSVCRTPSDLNITDEAWAELEQLFNVVIVGNCRWKFKIFSKESYRQNQEEPVRERNLGLDMRSQ